MPRGLRERVQRAHQPQPQRRVPGRGQQARRAERHLRDGVDERPERVCFLLRVRLQHTHPTLQAVDVLPAVHRTERLFGFVRERASEQRRELPHVRERQRVGLILVEAVNLTHASGHEHDVLDGLGVDELGVGGELAVHALRRALQRRRREHRRHVADQQDTLHAQRGLARPEERQHGFQRLARQTLEGVEERHGRVQARHQEPGHVRVRELPEQVQRVPQERLRQRLDFFPARLLVRLEHARLVRVASGGRTE